MKMIIDRASLSGSEKSPCEGATLARCDDAGFGDIWHIEITSLEDLLKVVDREGNISIMPGYRKVNGEMPYDILLVDSWVD